MSKNETFPLVEKSYSRLPVKIPHSKYKEGRKSANFCPEEYAGLCSDGRAMNLESKSDMQCYSRARRHHYSTDKSTQMNIKNFYGAHNLESLLNTNNDIKNYTNVNKANNLHGRDPLSDIKNILLRTNDKLDMILSTLTGKKEHLLNSIRKESSNRTRRCKPSKYRTKSENSRNPPHLAQPDDKSPDLPNTMCTWSRCMSSTSISRLRSNPYFISPYFPPYYIKPISHYNYFKIFGPKYSDPDMTSNLWSPFMFMATSFNANNYQSGRTARSLENVRSDQSNPDGEQKQHSEDSEQRREMCEDLAKKSADGSEQKMELCENMQEKKENLKNGVERLNNAQEIVRCSSEQDVIAEPGTDK